MSDELLKEKENKFYELNVELERKTKELMKEVNSVVNSKLSFDNHDTSSSSIINKNNDNNKSLKSRLITSKYVSDSVIKEFQSHADSNQYLTKSKQSIDKEISERDEIVDKPIQKDNRNDAVVRFFKSKSRILETELEAVKIEYKKKCDYSVELQVENKKIDEERVKYHGQLTSLKETLNKVEATSNVQLTNLQRSENENAALRKEIEALRKELKSANQNSSNYNIRLNRSLEENERLRKALKCSQLDEKELKDDNRKLEEEKKAIVTNFEKQRSELLHAFKKQMLLVDNLKKQKAHLEASMLIKYTEQELLKLLDWKLDTV